MVSKSYSKLLVVCCYVIFECEEDVCGCVFWYMQLTEIILKNSFNVSLIQPGKEEGIDPVNLLFSISFIAKQTENNRWRLNAASGAFRFGNLVDKFLYKIIIER